MPTILFVQGWRFHFYSNEGNEPMHVHAVKGDAECLRREVRQIIFEHFDQLVAAWREHFGGDRAK